MKILDGFWRKRSRTTIDIGASKSKEVLISGLHNSFVHKVKFSTLGVEGSG